MSTGKPTSPTGAKIRFERKLLGLTQAAAADLLYVDARTWRKWEGDERVMMPALWELFLIKANQK